MRFQVFQFKIIFFCIALSVALFGTTTEEKNFTKTEIEYLKTKQIIKMCNNPNWEPLEFALNDDQSKMSGIVIDVLHILEENLNIEFQNVPTKDWSESQKFLKEKKCDILPAATYTKKRAEYANFTQPYLDYKIAIIAKTTTQIVDSLNDFENKTMTRKKGSGLIDIVKEKNPSIHIIETDDYLQSLLLVQDGKADFTVAPVPEAGYYMSKFGLYDLHIIGYVDSTFKLSMMVRDDDPLLLSILDKSLSHIKPHQMKQIHDDWTNFTFKESFFETKTAKVFFIISLLLVLLFVYRHYLVKKTNKNLKEAVRRKTEELEKANQELVEYSQKLKDLNENLEQKIVIEVDKTKKIEQQLFQSEKMAAMGEMIGNIAHQWRQPLSLISTSATGILMQQEFNILEDKYLTDRMNDINNATQFLSKTIDDFRDLIKGDLIVEKFDILEPILKCLVIEEPILRNNQVVLVKDFDENLKITSYQNPIIQSLMNIINNAKDVLVETKLEKKYIFLTTKKEKDGLLICVKDNGGGISEGIMEHIFEPYFTTKHKSQGTGLGLHMTYNMITVELQGNIIVKNRTFEYEGNIYNGAEFIIKLPFELIINEWEENE